MDPPTEGAQKFQTAGAFAHNALMDFMSCVNRPADSKIEVTVHIVHEAQPFRERSQLFVCLLTIYLVLWLKSAAVYGGLMSFPYMCVKPSSNNLIVR